jgi:hypothetical protein
MLQADKAWDCQLSLHTTHLDSRRLRRSLKTSCKMLGFVPGSTTRTAAEFAVQVTADLGLPPSQPRDCSQHQFIHVNENFMQNISFKQCLLAGVRTPHSLVPLPENPCQVVCP